MAEVLFEFRRVGNMMRVSAIDPYTNTEVTLAADPKVGKETMKRLAMRKLEYVLERNRAKARHGDDNLY